MNIRNEHDERVFRERYGGLGHADLDRRELQLMARKDRYADDAMNPAVVGMYAMELGRSDAFARAALLDGVAKMCDELAMLQARREELQQEESNGHAIEGAANGTSTVGAPGHSNGSANGSVNGSVNGSHH